MSPLAGGGGICVGPTTVQATQLV